uniref:Zinc finger protein 235 n=1 Tax=Culex pipiens TaxID=7175 RepID=A0A8D8A961_CULPI
MEDDDDDPQTVLRRCRLCLHSDPSKDIFAAPNQEVTREALAFLELSGDELLSPVCASCVQTIRLFDAFGEMCRRVDKLFREAEVLPWDRWEGYREQVTASATLVQARRDEVGRFAEDRKGAVVEIKQEADNEAYLEEFDAGLSRDLVDIKEEKVEAFDFEGTSDKEDRQQTDQKQTDFLEKRLQVVQALEAELDLLPPDEVSHHKIPWIAVSERLGWDLDETKQTWESSKRWHKRKLRKVDLTDGGRPLYDIVQSLLNRLNQPAKPRAVKRAERKRKLVESSVSRRLDLGEKVKLAELIHEQEFLWNTKHVDYHNQEKRAETWDELAALFDIDAENTRKEWRYLRDMYRSRRNRIGGPISECDDMRDVQLYRLLDAMLRDNLQLGLRSAKATPVSLEAPDDWSQRLLADTPFRSAEQRLALAEEIGRHAVIWNAKHPDCGNAVKRGEAWNSIATVLDCSKRVLQQEWSRFVQRLDQASRADEPEAYLQDPLHHRLHQMLLERGSIAVTDEETVILPRRRFNGKRSFDPEGCIKLVDANGVARYYKVCELCGKEVERSLFEVHMNQHNGLTPYACSYEGCDKRYGNRTTRDRHEFVKHASEGRSKIECPECDEKFLHQARYDYHYAVKHKSEEVPCDICGKRLKHRNLLQAHIRKAHNSRYECSQCGKFLQSKYALETHMRIHTNEKPFGCELCGERFRIKVLMKRHLANVHNVQLEEMEAAKKGR